MFTLCSTHVSSVSVLNLSFDILGQYWLCIEFLDLCFDFFDLRFDFLFHNRVCFNFWLNLKLLLDRGFSVAVLDSKVENKSFKVETQVENLEPGRII